MPLHKVAIMNPMTKNINLAQYSPAILMNDFPKLYKDLKVTQLLIGYTAWCSQSEVVLLSNLQNLGEKDKKMFLRMPDKYWS